MTCALVAVQADANAANTIQNMRAGDQITIGGYGHAGRHSGLSRDRARVSAGLGTEKSFRDDLQNGGGGPLHQSLNRVAEIVQRVGRGRTDRGTLREQRIPCQAEHSRC